MAAGALLYAVLEDVPNRTRTLSVICIAGSTTVASAMISGQLTPALLLIGGASLFLYRRNRPVLTGCALGLLCIKPHFAIAVFVLLLITRQRTLAAVMAAVTAALTALSLAIVGPDGAQGFIGMMARSFSHPASLYIDVRTEQNVRGLFALFHVYGGPAVGATAWALMFLALFLVSRAVARSPYTGAERALYLGGLAAVFVCSAAVHIQFYYLALLAFPAVFIVRRAASAPGDVRARYYGVLVLTVLWLELAGTLAGARLSVSFMPLLAFTLMYCEWPRVEKWLDGRESEAAIPHGEPSELPPDRGGARRIALTLRRRSGDR